MPNGERRLAAIMFTDMVGYTALGQKNESLSLALVEEQQKLIRPILLRHHGREIKTIGDAFLVEFPNALDAVRCAYDIQRSTRDFNIALQPEQRLHLRIGIHDGDVVESGGDISGDAVNVASRIEPLAEDGGVCLSRQVYDHVKNKFELPLTGLGAKSLKNVSEPIEVFRMLMPWEQPDPAEKTIPPPRDRIAILPFANMSPDPNDEYFADSITDEVITTVSGISGLKVISRTSVMGYKGTSKKLKDIGRELEVGSVLEGSFKKAGNKIRVTTQLIDVAKDEHLWAQNYDRELDDIFAVQSDVAKQVADALRVRILTPERRRLEMKPTESTRAYSSYLKGRYLWNKRGFNELKRALECFEEAVREDPGFALGHVGVADSYLMLRENWKYELETSLERAKTVLSRALELDPDIAEAHTTKGQLLVQDYELDRAQEEYRKSIDLKPGYSTTHLWYSVLLQCYLKWDEALEQMELALELDPLSSRINLNYGILWLNMNDYPKALEFFKRAGELGDVFAHMNSAVAYGMMQMYDEMRHELRVAQARSAELPLHSQLSFDAWAAYFSRDKESLRRLLPEIEAHFEELDFGATGVADVHFLLGENDTGFEWLEKAYSRRESALVQIRVPSPGVDNVRSDPRYLRLLERLGLD